MQFLRLGPMGHEFPVALGQGEYFGLGSVPGGIVRAAP